APRSPGAMDPSASRGVASSDGDGTAVRDRALTRPAIPPPVPRRTSRPARGLRTARRRSTTSQAAPPPPPRPLPFPPPLTPPRPPPLPPPPPPPSPTPTPSPPPPPTPPAGNPPHRHKPLHAPAQHKTHATTPHVRRIVRQGHPIRNVRSTA